MTLARLATWWVTGLAVILATFAGGAVIIGPFFGIWEPLIAFGLVVALFGVPIYAIIRYAVRL